MFEEKYKDLLNRFAPDEALLQRTVAAAEQAQRERDPEEDSPAFRRKRRKKLIPAIAAVLVAVIALGVVILLPAEHTSGFAIIASAASAGDCVLSTTEFRPICDVAAAHSESGFIGLNLSRLYRDYDSLVYADEPIVIAVGLFCLHVEGDDIAYVSYALNNGKFQVHESTGYMLNDYEGKVDSYLGCEQEYTAFYDSIKFSYNNQLSKTPGRDSLFGDGVFMYIPYSFDPERDDEALNRLLNLSALKSVIPEELEPEEEFCSVYEDFMNILYRDTKLYVTVIYKDGRSETFTLSLSATCTINGTVPHRFRVAPGDGESSFETHPVYNYTVALNAKIEEPSQQP